jgi:hypothetical protein
VNQLPSGGWDSCRSTSFARETDKCLSYRRRSLNDMIANESNRQKGARRIPADRKTKMAGTRGALLRGLNATETFEPQFIHLSKNTTHFGKPTRIVPPNADQGAEHSHTLQTDSCSTTSIKLKVFVASPARASDLNCVRGNWRLERCDRNVDLQSPQILWLDSFLSYPRG